MNKKMMIFDLDGTLLDTIRDLANATNYALSQFNFPTHPEDAYRYFVGNGVNKLLERALPEGHKDADSISMVKHEFIRYYTAHGEESTRPYPGISDLLANLQHKGIMLGVASNKMHAATVTLVHEFFPDIRFTGILGQRDGIPVKPAPDILKEMIDIAGVTAEEALFIGDTSVDATTALNAGMDFVGVLWGFRPREELAAAGATNFIGHPSELLPA